MTQQLYIIISASAFIFIILLTVIFIDQRRIRALQKLVEEERGKRLIPLLNLSIDRRSLALCLVNEGDIMVREISIRDIVTVVDVGFQKRLGLRFSPVEELKPHESSPLDVTFFDNGQAIPPGAAKRMGGVLLPASFKAFVKCKNLTGVPFLIEIIKEGQDSKIGRIKILKEPKPQKTNTKK